MLDKLTYAGRRENLAGRRRTSFVHGAIEDPDAVAGAIDGVDAVVNFAAETHVDRSIAEPDAFVAHARAGHVRAARGGARRAALRYLQVSTDEVYGSIEEGSFTEASPLAPVVALQRDEGRRRPARRRATSTPSALETRDLPRLEQLRARTSTPRSSSR